MSVLVWTMAGQLVILPNRESRLCIVHTPISDPVELRSMNGQAPHQIEKNRTMVTSISERNLNPLTDTTLIKAHEVAL